MSRSLRWLLAIGALIVLAGPPARSDEKEEMVDNPRFQFWAGAKVGSTAVHHEETKLGGPAKQLVPDGVDEKRIEYKLVEADDKRVVIETVVTEREFLGYVRSAPTRHIYPAKLKRTHLQLFYKEFGIKGGDEETVKVEDKEFKCKTASGTLKRADGSETEYKLWLSDEVPGRIVKHVRKTRQKGELVAETTITLRSCKKAE
jgi:hypothetical protein